ncbi:MAG: 4Fe-4S dicluster domain-containing protein [Deltaproteobacteria bacterium]|nr:4Fe-4S dicluster domain-containing protein [Deltaproteobacteria bacterium]
MALKAADPRGAAQLIPERKGAVQECYQCQRCTAGCPVAFAMDYKPNQIVQLVSLGLEERALASRTIWICASCYTCGTRCPNDIDIARVMDELRQRALREGVPPAEKEVPLFHAAFLDSIRAHGRVHEIGLIARYKMKTGKFFEDLKLGWKMFAKGKLKLRPSRVKRKREIAEFFSP